MQSDQQLNQNPFRQWFTLDELLTSVLADVIETDAQFQLMQGQAWLQFGQDMRRLNNLPQLETLDFTAGFGRLENLGLSELSLTLCLECYKPGWLKRFWWICKGLLGIKPTQQRARYRPAKPEKNSYNRLQLAIMIKRGRQGHWEVETSPDKDLLDVA